MVKCFKLRLSGDAHQQIKLENIATFSQLKKRLRELYKENCKYEDYAKDLTACIQQPGEDTRTFLRRQQDNKYVKTDERKAVKAELEATAIRTVMHGLTNTRTKSHLITVDSEVASFREIMTNIERYEKGLATLTEHSDKTARPVVGTLHNPMEELRELMKVGFGDMAKSHGELKEEMRREMNTINWKIESVQNSLARRIDNLEGEGRTNRAPAAQKQADYGSARKPKSTDKKLIECFKCRDIGHYSTNCNSEVCRYCKTSYHKYTECIKRYPSELRKNPEQGSLNQGKQGN